MKENFKENVFAAMKEHYNEDVSKMYANCMTDDKMFKLLESKNKKLGEGGQIINLDTNIGSFLPLSSIYIEMILREKGFKITRYWTVLDGLIPERKKDRNLFLFYPEMKPKAQEFGIFIILEAINGGNFVSLNIVADDEIEAQLKNVVKKKFGG